MKTNQFTPLLAAFAALLLFTIGCNTASKESTETVDNATLKQEIEAANVEWMDFISKGDSAGFANFYTADGKLMFANAPAFEGHQAIQTVTRGIIDSGIAKADFRATEVWGMGDMAIEEGEYTLFDKSGTQLDKGKYIVVWKKEDGKWKPFRDIANTDLPLPTAK